MAIDWGLAGGGNSFQSALGFGMQLGERLRQREDDKAIRSALGSYAASPSDETLAPVIAADPRLGLTLQGQMQQQRQAQTEQKRADLPLLTRLVETSTDEASYQRNRETAQQYGIDTSSLPPQFTPEWRDTTLTAMKALQDPKAQEALSTAGKQATDMGYRPGTPEFAERVQQIWQTEQRRIIPVAPGGTAYEYSPVVSASAPQAPAMQTPAQQPTSKPTGMTDDQIWTQAHEAVRNGANAEEVFRRLQSWGMKP